MKEVQIAACGIGCTDLNNNTLKILSNYFSCNKKLKEEKIVLERNRYSTSIENMENKRPDARRDNRYF